MFRCGNHKLCGKLSAAFGAAGSDNLAAAYSCHARAEAVTAFTNDFAGLVCALHGRIPYINQEGAYNV